MALFLFVCVLSSLFFCLFVWLLYFFKNYEDGRNTLKARKHGHISLDMFILYLFSLLVFSVLFSYPF